MVWTLIVFLVITGTLLVIAFVYEDEVKDYMIQELNKNLKTKVIVDSKNIKLSLLRNFPYASLDFKDAVMLESPVSNGKKDKKGNKKLLPQDTLFSAQRFSLQFNLIDIIRKNYVVKKVKAEDAKVKLRTGADGSVNWDVWKGSGDTAASSEESAFNLEKFQMDNVSLSYYDFKNKTDVSCTVRSGTIGGEFTSKEYDLSITGDLQVNHFKLDSINYLDKKPVKLDLNLNVDNDKNLYTFSEALVTVSDLKIAVEGKYINTSPAYTDINLKGQEMDIQSVLSLLPEKYHSYVSDYDSDGEFYCNAGISGKWHDETMPEVKADFGIKKANITQLSSGIVLKDAHIEGNYFSSSQYSKSFLDLKNFSASLANGRISGVIRMDNFSSPIVAASIHADMPLEDARQLLKMDTLWNYAVESMYGNLKINMEYKGQLKNSGKYQKSDFADNCRALD